MGMLRSEDCGGRVGTPTESGQVSPGAAGAKSSTTNAQAALQVFQSYQVGLIRDDSFVPFWALSKHLTSLSSALYDQFESS
jgi:hypothetical protein